MKAARIMRRLAGEIGVVGMGSMAVLLAGSLFFVGVLRPLEARNAEIERQIARNMEDTRPPGMSRAPSATPAAKLAAFYEFLATEQRTTEWLDRLYAAGERAGLELRTAEYHLQKTGTRIERYEVRLPVSGSYAQVRAFLESALADIPMLSLDEVKFRRERASDRSIQAELRLTLHLLHP